MKPISALLLLGSFGVPQLLVAGFSPGAPRRPSTSTGVASTENAPKRALFDGGALQKGMEEATKIMTATTLALLLAVSPVFAADYAGTTISGQDLSGQDLSGRTFISVTAQGTNFRNANLQRADFTGAKLEKADFTGADLREAKFDDAALDGTIMKDVTAQRASFSKTILDIGDFENALFLWLFLLFHHHLTVSILF